MTPDNKILWAEDDQDDIEIISEAARELGVEHLIYFVTNGEDLLTYLYRALLSKILPRLIVLDNNMPVMTGSQALNRIIEFEQLKTIPIAFFTTGRAGGPEKHFQEHHAKIFIKPTNYHRLVDTLKELLELSNSPLV